VGVEATLADGKQSCAEVAGNHLRDELQLRGESVVRVLHGRRVRGGDLLQLIGALKSLERAAPDQRLVL